MTPTAQAIQQADAIRSKIACPCGHIPTIRFTCDRCEQPCCGVCSELEFDAHDDDKPVRICLGCHLAFRAEQALPGKPLVDRDPDFGPVTREMVRSEMAYERWKESRN